MNYQEIIDLGLKKGIKDLEVKAVKSQRLSITVYDSKVENCVKSDVNVMSLRGIYKGKMGKCVLENFSDQSVEHMLDALIDNAKAITLKEPAILFKGAKKYPLVAELKSDFDKYSLDYKINLLLKLEKEIKKGKCVSQVETTQYSENRVTVTLVNSKGLDKMREEAYLTLYSVGVFQKGDDIVTAYEPKVTNKLSDLDPLKIAKTTIKKGLAKLGGSSVASGEYQVVFENEAFGELLSSYEDIFSQESAYRNLSLLKDKLGEVIASEKVTLLDDPFNKKALFKIPFDDEGVPCKKKKIIDNGKFTSFMNDLKMAKIHQKRPTGNGFGGGIGSTNLILVPGKKTLNEVLNDVSDGIYINELAGTHVGVNTSSGDFSLQAAGFLIKNGKLDRAVKMIVVSGNFFRLLMDITEVAKDLKVDYSGIGSPSVAVKGLVIGGM